MIHELRIYKLHPGRLPAFVAAFRKAQGFMADYGITFVAAWRTDREDEFCWLRAFADAAARDAAIAAFYSSPEWLGLVDELRPLIRRRTVRILDSLELPGSQL